MTIIETRLRAMAPKNQKEGIIVTDEQEITIIEEPDIVIEEESEEEPETFDVEPALLDNVKGTDDAVGSVSLDEIEDE